MEELKKSRVLIVEDEKGLRLGTKRLLESEGYSVSTAENGSEGIQLGTNFEYDLAIIDLKMPDIDGIQVLKEIRRVYPNTVCFIATAYASYETAIESTKIGAFSYIPKPFSPEELLKQLTLGNERRLLLLEAEKWRKEREERLLEVAFEKTRLNTIINSIGDGVLVVNKDGVAVLFNPSALRFLNINNIVVEEFILDKLNPEISELINKILKKRVYEKRTFIRQINVNNLVIEAASSPVPHPDGSLAGVVVVMRDITEMKKIEMLKSQFVSMVSHELKAPIAAVLGFLKLTVDEKINITEDQRKDFIARSQLRLDSLLKMVNDLLDISRMETKTVQRDIKELGIKEIINGILEIFQLEITKKNIAVSFNIEDNLPALKADYEEMNRLFTNLISNAIKYNKKDGTIDISLKKFENYLSAEIKDSGIGLKPEEKEKLFREFFRAKNELTKTISGTGLGLSIVKRIVDSYAGKIEVISEYKAGTTFRIYLPV